MWCPYVTKNFNFEKIILVITIFGEFSVLSLWSLFSTFYSFVLPLSVGSITTFCFLIKFPIGVVSSSSSSDKETWCASSWVVFSLATSYVSSSSLSFSSNCWICSYATSRALVYFLVCSKCHLLNFVLSSSNSSPISIGSCSTSSSYNITLVLFSMGTFSQTLVVCT